MTFWVITIDGLNSSTSLWLLYVYCIRQTFRENWYFENDNATLCPMSILSDDGDLSLLYLRSLFGRFHINSVLKGSLTDGLNKISSVRWSFDDVFICRLLPSSFVEYSRDRSKTIKESGSAVIFWIVKVHRSFEIIFKLSNVKGLPIFKNFGIIQADHLLLLHVANIFGWLSK